VRVAGRSLDLADLRSLAAAAEAGTLGRAALRLHVSQPALTRRLQGLEALAGVPLLERSPRGVVLTPAGRRLYEHARPLLGAADEVEAVLAALRQEAAPIRLAASHSAVDAFVGRALLGDPGAEPRLAVELVTANSLVVRRLVAEGRADLGVAAGRPDATPNPTVREEPIADDEVVCAVPNGHLWAQRRRISARELTRTPMVLRDRSSNARWTVDAVLRRQGLALAPPLEEAPTPASAKRAAIARNAPVMLSWRVLEPDPFVRVDVDGLSFPRKYFLVLPAAGAATAEVLALKERLEAAVAG
jgi:DNA-binding transcriptional LysR family regulator